MRARAADTFSPAALAVARRSSSASEMTTFMSETSLSVVLAWGVMAVLGRLGRGPHGVCAGAEGGGVEATEFPRAAQPRRHGAVRGRQANTTRAPPVRLTATS